MDKYFALEILNREREYEDALADRLSFYFINSLEDIGGLTEKERAKIKQSLSIIMTDSRRHSDMFNQLVQLVFESNKDDF